MSAEILLIVIAFLLIALALGNSIKPLHFVNEKLRLPLGIAGCLLLIYAGSTFEALHFSARIEKPVIQTKKEINYPVNSVQVISPIEGDSIDCRILTMGVYPEGHDKDIWVLLKPSDNKYYPQSDHTNTSFKYRGEWQVLTRFGGDQAEQFEVIVYETDTYTSSYFSQIISDWKTAGDYPGLRLNEIPDGAREVDRITVFMRYNCRGLF